MENDNFLVLEIGHVEHLCTNLREILEGAPNLTVKREQRPLMETFISGNLRS